MRGVGGRGGDTAPSTSGKDCRRSPQHQRMFKRVRIIYSDPDGTDSSSEDEDGNDRNTKKITADAKRVIREICMPLETPSHNRKVNLSPPEPEPDVLLKKKSAAERVEGAGNARVRMKPKHVGVRMRKWGKWAAEIRNPLTGRREWLGTFNTEEEAYATREKWRLEFEAAMGHPSTAHHQLQLLKQQKSRTKKLKPRNRRAGLDTLKITTTTNTDAGATISEEISNCETPSPSSVLDVTKPVPAAAAATLGSGGVAGGGLFKKEKQQLEGETAMIVDQRGLVDTEVKLEEDNKFELVKQEPMSWKPISEAGEFGLLFDELKMEDFPMCNLGDLSDDLGDGGFDLELGDLSWLDENYHFV